MTTATPPEVLRLDLGGWPTSDALEVAERLRSITELPQHSARDKRTAERLDLIATALEHAAEAFRE